MSLGFFLDLTSKDDDDDAAKPFGFLWDLLLWVVLLLLSVLLLADADVCFRLVRLAAIWRMASRAALSMVMPGPTETVSRLIDGGGWCDAAVGALVRVAVVSLVGSSLSWSSSEVMLLLLLLLLLGASATAVKEVADAAACWCCKGSRKTAWVGWALPGGARTWPVGIKDEEERPTVAFAVVGGAWWWCWWKSAGWLAAAVY